MKSSILVFSLVMVLTTAAHAAAPTSHCTPVAITSGAEARDVTLTIGPDGSVGAIWCVVVRARLPLSLLSSNVAVFGTDGKLLGSNGQGYANIMPPADGSSSGGAVEIVFGATISTAPHTGGLANKVSVNIQWRDCLPPVARTTDTCTNPDPQLHSTVDWVDVTPDRLTRGH